MNYYIHNNTDGYENPTCNLRDTILTTLKGYGIFQHLRDTSLSQLDQYDVSEWLWDTSYYEDKIKTYKEKIKQKQEEINSTTEEQIEAEYDKEVFRINWYNNPQSNYSANEVNRIQKCLDEYKPKLKSFTDICTYSWINDILKDVIDTAEADLNRYKKDAEKEAYQREFKPKAVPSYEDFKEEYKEDQLMWLERFEDDLRSAKSSLKKCKEYNTTIKQIFMWLDQLEGVTR